MQAPLLRQSKDIFETVPPVNLFLSHQEQEELAPPVCPWPRGRFKLDLLPAVDVVMTFQIPEEDFSTVTACARN
jgi:hypothetical protein